jgi:hypothetical protein
MNVSMPASLAETPCLVKRKMGTKFQNYTFRARFKTRKAGTKQTKWNFRARIVWGGATDRPSRLQRESASRMSHFGK